MYAQIPEDSELEVISQIKIMFGHTRLTVFTEINVINIYYTQQLSITESAEYKKIVIYVHVSDS